jgi:GNAT superfamily N-acetyltransferase
VGLPSDQSAAVIAALGADADLVTVRRELPGLLGRPDNFVYLGVMRWCTEPVAMPDAGEWVDAEDPVVPPWLRPFGHQVLIARDDDGRYVAGVGIKRHDDFGHELSVGTEPAARGRGLARRLVAQAARKVLADGKVPTYLHDPANIASGRVADAAGFPDRGWQVLGMFAPVQD